MNRRTWITSGFEEFRQGTFGNGGQNLYVSRKGVLQRIYQYDLNHNGYFDLVFANCQNHHESAESFVYDASEPSKAARLPGQGALSGFADDLGGTGWQDIVVAGNYDMAAPFASTDVYFGGPDGYSENCRTRIPTPYAEDCCSGTLGPGGKKALVFAMPTYKTVRIFTQTDCGFEWTGYKDYPIPASLVACADLDGDGWDELIVRRRDETETTVFWGGPDGINLERKSVLPPLPSELLESAEGSEARQSEMEKAYDAPRLLKKVRWNGRDCFTLSTGRKLFFYSSDRSRQLKKLLELDVPQVMAVAVGDFNGDGLADLALACRAPHSFVWLNAADGFLPENRIEVPTQYACDVAVQDSAILFAQCATERTYTNDSLLYTFQNGKMTAEPVRFLGEDTRRCSLFRNPDGKLQIMLLSHYARSSVGFDKSFIYWGGEDGYSPARMTPVPGWCAVDSLMADLDDDGWAELLVCNNSENSLHLDPGHHVHHFGPNGFEPEKSYTLKTDLGWGSVCADFDRDGYLDIITVSDHWTNLRYFHGGPDGFTRVETIDLHGIGSPRWLACADLNRNGYLDLIVPIITSNRSLILWGGPDGYSFDRRTELSVFMGVSARVADLSGNGYPDLIIGGHVKTPRNGELMPHEPHHSFLTIYWNGPDGISERRKCVLRADAACSMAIGDFNNDGWLDIFCGNYHGGKDRDINSFIYWNRQGHFQNLDRECLYCHSVSGAVAADFNQDGFVDLAIANHKVDGDHHGWSAVWWNGPDGFNPKAITALPTEGPHGMTALEPGNQLTRGPEEYYYSRAWQADEDLVVETVEVEAELPPKTWVTARVRCAEKQEALEAAEWHEAQGVEVQEGSWLQYRLELGATLSLRTPRVTRVTVHFR